MTEIPAVVSDNEEEDSPLWEVPEGHQADEFGEHDPDECDTCLLAREPRIKELGSPICLNARLTDSGQPELMGYLLNRPSSPACAFLDEQSLCSIYPTRPLLCRLFSCEEAKSEGLIELGVPNRPGSRDE